MLQDRLAVEEDYQLVAAADAVLNDSKDLREIVQNQRADKDEESDDQENRRESSDRGTPHLQSHLRSQVRAQPAEQRPAKAFKKSGRGRSGSMQPQPQSPARQSQLDQPHSAQPESDSHLPEQRQSTTTASNQSTQQATARQEMPNGHAQPAASLHSRTLELASRPQVTELDTQNRETRMCSWCPTAAVLASG